MTNTATAPPGFPAGIPVRQETFENWDMSINVPNIWTCEPRNEEDVVAVCNWAVTAQFKVRATGIRHTWSPITIAANTAPGANILLVDTTKSLTSIAVTPATGNAPAQVWVQTGATMDALMLALESADGGNGTAPGFSFAHIPAPGHITVGGALAINAHGTAVRTPPHDDLNIPYGSLSNQILAFTAVISDPTNPTTYVAQTFQRDDGDAHAFLVHVGRAFLLNVTLQVADNYNLRCQSFTNIPPATLFAAPTESDPIPANSVAAFLEQSGRIEVIWFPQFPGAPTMPWLKVWTVSPEKPDSSREVTAPYNYPFSDNLPTFLTDALKKIVEGKEAWLTPLFCAGFSSFTAAALNGEVLFPSSTDLWGPSKNTMIYVKDTTLRVTANGYAVQMKKADVQQAVADFAAEFDALLRGFMFRLKFPINSPMEIRITSLDDPSTLVTPAGNAPTPVISSLAYDSVAAANGWDVAVWFDVLTLVPEGDPQEAWNFYAQLEDWIVKRFSIGYRALPEWSKGWAYTSRGGPWTSPAYMELIRQTLTTGRSADDNWAYETATLARYDAAGLFHAPLLDQLFRSS